MVTTKLWYCWLAIYSSNRWSGGKVCHIIPNWAVWDAPYHNVSVPICGMGCTNTQYAEPTTCCYSNRVAPAWGLVLGWHTMGGGIGNTNRAQNFKLDIICVYLGVLYIPLEIFGLTLCSPYITASCPLKTLQANYSFSSFSQSATASAYSTAANPDSTVW